MTMLSKKQVIGRTGLSAVTIWRRVRAGDFPPPRALSENRKGWLESELLKWVESRPVADAYKSIEESAL